jgi:transcriptional regulator with XRE-family HTH domain
MTVDEMADELGFSRTNVSRWVNDRLKPRDVILKAWALRCGVPYVWLYDGTIPPDGPGSNIARCLTLPDRRGRSVA